MALHLLRKYPELLEILHLSPHERHAALRDIFIRDIENHPDLRFRTSKIRPIKGEELGMQLLFRHLTTEENHEIDEKGQPLGGRVFEMKRSQRLHWVKHHITESTPGCLSCFTVKDRVKSKWVYRTYLLDTVQKYVIILEPYRSIPEYYLLTAYPLLPRNYKKIKNKEKRKEQEPQ